MITKHPLELRLESIFFHTSLLKAELKVYESSLKILKVKPVAEQGISELVKTATAILEIEKTMKEPKHDT